MKGLNTIYLAQVQRSECRFLHCQLPGKVKLQIFSEPTVKLSNSLHSLQGKKKHNPFLFLNPQLTIQKVTRNKSDSALSLGSKLQSHPAFSLYKIIIIICLFLAFQSSFLCSPARISSLQAQVCLFGWFFCFFPGPFSNVPHFSKVSSLASPSLTHRLFNVSPLIKEH